ncbi:hypothetical protein K7X08_000365 [Anisodus acutangulus]|uniref:Uncharacterized protein n=1 Tax=Anisodus acutangulus TaxID=402998 RepID=A0A9Q1M3D1_9SOLA|nr:hypothetical protein K7X08_000365 [Anisodus acutangulus]
MKSFKLCYLFPILVLSFLVLTFPLITASIILFRGDSFSVKDDSDFITSPQKTFTCGFYPLGNTNAYYFGIWYTKSKEKTVVWNAKQDRPVNIQDSKLTLRKNGALVLTDVDDTIVWQTNTTSFDIERAELLESGNLVLRNRQGDILWQSFDLPTDTLLPHQFFTKNHRLMPPLRKGGISPGYFSLYFDSDNVLRMIYDGPQVSSIYWPNPDGDPYWNGRTSQNSTRLAYFDGMGRFFSSDRLQFNVSDMGFGILRRMTIDTDGNLRVYSLDNSTGLWKISWQAVAQACVVHGICGRFSICTYVTELKCTCPPGYQMVNASDWSQGCRPMFRSRSLFDSEHVKFVEIPNVDYWGFDLNATVSFSLGSCKALCLDDPNCRAFVYRRNGAGTCYTKGILFNGYRSPGFPGSVFLKVPMNLSTSESGHLILDHGADGKCGSSSEDVLFGSPSIYVMDFKKVKWIYPYLFCSTLGGIEILFFVLGWWALFSKHGISASIEDGYKMVSSTQFRRFTYTELKKATKNFKVELGRGVKDNSDFITSPQNTFTCGFYPIGNANAYYFGIWFTNSREKTVVWNANQDRPVSIQGSKLALGNNGALVLTDVDDTIIWQTNTTSFDIERAELLETGNLVLKNPQGDILWQSFDLPTDTLLPHQFFTKNHRLVPPLRKGSLSPGYFSLYFDSDNVLRMIYDGSQVSSI